MSKFLALQKRPRDPFAAYLHDHRPDLVVPEGAIVPLDGKVGWTPGDESPHDTAGGCSKCGGRIGDGSRLFCPKCQASGFEAKLAEQRRIVPPPPRRTRAPKAAPKRPTRKQRRAG